MTQVLLVIHLLIAAALVAVVLLQRSEGGALGIGGGGFMTGRGAANLLTRATAVLAAMFFATSIILTILARHTSAPSIFNEVKGVEQTRQAPASGGAPAASGETKSEAPSSAAPETPPAPNAPLSK